MKRALIIVFLFVAIVYGCQKQDQPLWILKLKSRSYTTPIIHGGRFFVFSQAGEAVCGNLKTGNPIWRKTLPGSILGDPALSDDGTLFIITQNGSFLAIDSQTGNIRWQTSIPDSFIAPVTLSADMILLPSEHGTLYARSRKDGSERWTFSGAVKFNAQAIVFDEHILIGGWAKDFYCLKLDGALNWKVTAADRITNAAVVSGNTVIFPSYDRFIYAVDIPSGRMLWRYSTKMPSNVVLENGTIYFSSGKDLFGLSTTSGKLLYARQFGAMIDRLYVEPPDVLALSNYVYRVDPALSHTTIFLRGFQPIFKLSSAEGMLLACDDLYSIYGYGKPVR